MKTITKLMINEYKIKEVDMMGYKLQKGDVFSYHHLVIPKRYGGPLTMWNGAILCNKTSHPYLHLIERVDHDMFVDITCLLIQENISGRLDVEIIKRIEGYLLEFEDAHKNDYNRKGLKLIKPEYKKRDYSSLIKLNNNE